MLAFLPRLFRIFGDLFSYRLQSFVPSALRVSLSSVGLQGRREVSVHRGTGAGSAQVLVMDM